MTKLLKYLFGWDYILWENTCSSGTSRIRLDGDDRAYYRSWVYGITVIEKPEQVIWLTCPSSNYLGDKNE